MEPENKFAFQKPWSGFINNRDIILNGYQTPEGFHQLFPDSVFPFVDSICIRYSNIIVRFKLLFFRYFPDIQIYLRKINICWRLFMNMSNEQLISYWHKLAVNAPTSDNKYFFVW